MNKLILEAMPSQNRLILYEGPRLASGSKGVVQVRFSYALDPERWAGPTKAAVFYRDEDTVFHVLLENDVATVPHEVLADEGYFYMGLMGMQGDEIITTEAIRMNVVQGAITTATDVSDPTPDIYQQILNKYEDLEKKVFDFTRMEGSASESVYPLEDEYIIEGSVTTNGISAAVSFKIDGLTLSAYGVHVTDGCILPQIAPLFPKDMDYYIGTIPLKVEHPDLEVSIVYNGEGGWPVLNIKNKTDQDVGIYGAFVSGFYDLASPFIAELADTRVGGDGKVYPLAGDAVREQLKKQEETKADKTEVANAVKGTTVTRKSVKLFGLSPLPHELGVKLEGITLKNWLPTPYSEVSVAYEMMNPVDPVTGEYKTHGITFRDNGDGTITANGTAFDGWDPESESSSDGAYFYFLHRYQFANPEELPEKLYFAGCPAGGGEDTYFMGVGAVPDANKDYGRGTGPVTLYTENASESRGNRAQIYIAPGVTVKDLVFKPRLVGEEARVLVNGTDYYIAELDGTVPGIVTDGSQFITIEAVADADVAVEYNQDAQLAVANALKKDAVGQMLRLDDYSPLTTALFVGTSKPSEPVLKYGKNILDPAQWKKGDGDAIGDTTLDGDLLTTTFTNGAVHVKAEQTFAPGEYTVTLFSQTANTSLSMYIYDAADKATSIVGPFYLKNLTASGVESFNFKAEKSFVIRIGGSVGLYGTYSYKVQLELGTVNNVNKFAYEAYKEPVSYVLDELNTGGMSLGRIPVRGEVVTLLPTSSGTMLAVQYSQDLTKAIAELRKLVASITTAASNE